MLNNLMTIRWKIMFVKILHALPLIFGMSTIKFETYHLTQITLWQATITKCLQYFLKHPNISDFIGRLKDKHEYQHHKPEESSAQLKKAKKKLYDEIDVKLTHLLQAYEKRELDKLQFSVKCGRTVKTRNNIY